jgi:flavodoxin
MNTLIIYDSAFGNTEHIALAIAETLREHSQVQLTLVDEASKFDPKTVDLLIVGCPTQRHGLTPGIRTYLDKLPRGALDGVMAAAFDTRYRMSVWISGSAAWSVGRHLQRAGALLVLPPESFFVTNREGPLEDGEIERAVRWTNAILEMLEAEVPAVQ